MKTRSILAGWVVFAMLCGVATVTTAPAVAHGQTVVAARCTKCGSPVPTTSRAGQTCRRCGAYWATESNTYIPGGSSNAGSIPYLTPRQALALEYARMAHEQWMWVQQQRQIDREWRTTRAQEQREKEVEKREANRAKLREQAEQRRTRVAMSQ